MTLERGWYLINDQELFLFATSGFWDRGERMDTYNNVKKRYCGDIEPNVKLLQGKDGEHG